MLREHLDRVPATVLVSSEHGHGNFAARSMAAPLPLLRAAARRSGWRLQWRYAPLLLQHGARPRFAPAVWKS
jgi:hypothetical protein